MGKIKTYSVNLTVEEWNFMIEELDQRKNNEVEDAYIQAKIAASEDPDDPDYKPTDSQLDDYAYFQSNMDMYKSITAKVVKKEKSDNNKMKKLKESNSKLKYSNSMLKNELDIVRKKVEEHKTLKVDALKNTESMRLETVELKKIIEEQHKDLSAIKKKIKLFTDFVNK
tara:strand:- start:489 stop:995 length:507 start_codon:yes stop_codon:yes gene_type:complete